MDKVIHGTTFRKIGTRVYQVLGDQLVDINQDADSFEANHGSFERKDNKPEPASKKDSNNA